MHKRVQHIILLLVLLTGVHVNIFGNGLRLYYNSSPEALTKTRLLRQLPNNPDAITAANKLRQALAEKDLANFPDALAFVRNNPRGAEAWETIRLGIGNVNEATQFARDLKTLQKVSDMISEGSAFRNKFPNNWQTKLEEALFRNKHLNCSTCNGTFNRGPNMDEFLKDFEFIHLNFDETTDIGMRLHAWSKRKYLNGNDIPGSSGHISETHQTMNFIRKRGYKESDISKTDGVFFDDIENSKKFDLELITGTPKFAELKNKDFANMQSLPTSDANQVISATGAFSKIDNIDDYEWVAYLRRFGDNADPVDAVTTLKDLWKPVFVNKKVEIFPTMSTQLRESILGNGNANRFDLFEQAVDNTASNLYKFIKSE